MFVVRESEEKCLAVWWNFETVDGEIIEDEALQKAALAVFNEAADMVNELIIPGLNDILYKEKFPLSEEVRARYEKNAFDAIAAVYKVTAYSGFGKVGDKLIYPVRIDPWIGHWAENIVCEIVDL